MEAEKVLPFLMAGNSTLTLVSKASGTRFTYKVKAKKTEQETELWFVSLLSGPDNTSDYRCIGLMVKSGNSVVFRNTRKVSSSAPSVRGFKWLFETLSAGNHAKVAEQAETWHEGKCGRCNRKLTDPVSIAAGYGPKCRGEL